MRAKFLVSLVLGLVLAGLAVVPAQRSSALSTVDSGHEELFQFSLWSNNLKTASDGVVSRESLRSETGIDVGSAEGFRALRDSVSSRGGAHAGASLSAFGAVPSDAYLRVTSWYDVRGLEVVLRRGYYEPPNAGFGLKKIIGKHNLNTEAVRSATARTSRIQPGKGTDVAYYQDVYLIECRSRGPIRTCYRKDTKTVITVVDFRLIGKKKEPFGVVTAWCDGVPGACPNWVAEAINRM